MSVPPCTGAGRLALLVSCWSYTASFEFDDVCLNTSFVLPARRRVVAPLVSATTTLAELLRERAQDANAVEIGGPTVWLVGLYDLGWRSLDIVNLNSSTPVVAAYSAAASDGDVLYAGGRALGQFREGNALSLPFADGSVDDLLAFHTLEHFVDPLRVLREWDRVLRPGGALILALPWATVTFDRHVPVSTIYDLILDFRDDLGRHRPEIADVITRRAEIYAKLAGKRPAHLPPNETHTDPLQHWHVWDFALIKDALDCMGYEILFLEIVDNWHQFLIAEKRRSPLSRQQYDL